jgi:O-antigen ligase
VAIPLVNGFQILGILSDGPILSFAFSTIYLSWLTKQTFWKKKSIMPSTVIGHLVDVLSGIVIFSLVMGLCEYPLDIVLSRFRFLAFLGQKDPFWVINASQILLQGLFCFRLLELEVNGRSRQKFIWVFYLQAAIIICFSFFQIISHIPKLYRGNIGVFLPYNDIHSYGSCVVFLLFIFFSLAGNQNHKLKLFNIVIFGFFLFFTFMSFSRATWLAAIMIGVFTLALKLPKKKSLALILGLLTAVVFINIFQPNLLKSDNKIAKRYNELVLIKNYSTKFQARFDLWNRALKISEEYPLTGSGIGTFYRISPFFSDSKNKIISIEYENTHNYFLQFAAELGIPALLIFFCIIICALTGFFSSFVRIKQSGPIRKGLIFGLSAYLITLFTGNALLLSHQQFLFWFAIALVTNPYYQAGGKSLSEKISRWSPALIGIVSVILVLGHLEKLYSDDIRLHQYESGFYGYENWDGEKMRWTLRKASSRVIAGSNLFGFKVVAMPSNSQEPEGLRFKLFLNDNLLDEINFFNGGTQLRYYYIPHIKNQEVTIKTEVSKTFNPLIMGMNRDSRYLGVAMSPIAFLKIMPKDGVGFYDWETSENLDLPEWPPDRPLRFRMTGKRGSINLRSELQNGGVLFLRCGHPDITKDPVRVDILTDNKLIKQENFSDHGWKKVILTTEDIKGSKGLTLQVSRTWNPKLSGISENRRDLGVAVALLEEKS